MTALPAPDLTTTVLASWRTSSRVTADLVERLPAVLWNEAVPGAPLRTIRMIAAHLHNSRSQWIRTLGREHGIPVPALVDKRRVSRRQLLSALRRSSSGIEALLRLGIAGGGHVPPSRAYAWRNLPLALSYGSQDQ